MSEEAPDDLDGVWESECGVLWMFEVGGPAENEMRFCVGCGAPLVVADPETKNLVEKEDTPTREAPGA